MELKVIKNKLNFEEYTQFINNVIYTVFTFDKDNSPTSYLSEIQAFVLRLEFAKAYMGYDTTDKETSVLFDDVIGIDMYNHREEGLVYEQFSSMISVINNKIDFLKQQLLNQSKKDSLDELLQSVTKFVDSMSEKFKDVDLSNIDGLGQLGKKIEGLSDTKLVNALVKEISKSNIGK